MTTIAEELQQDVESQYVSERKGLSYITGRYVKQRLNEIFGWDGWSYEVVEQKMVHLDEEAVRWLAHVRLKIHQGEAPYSIIKDGIAIGHGTCKDRYGKPLSPGRLNEVIDFAAAEAVTDALKRAAVSLGQNLGLSLYPMTSDAQGHKTFDTQQEERTGVAPAEHPFDVQGFALRIGAAESLEELHTVGEDIGKADLTQPKKEILKALYGTAKKRLEAKRG
jgi:hypothetical protein